MAKRRIFIGVAWPYVNGDIHIGHLAGYLLPADIFARFHRLLGNQVLMVSGSDSYGTPITIEAEKRNLPPAEIVNIYHKHHLDLFKKLRLSFDIFTKTTTDNHRQIVQQFFIESLKKGFIFKDFTRQYYSEKEGRFLPDRYVEGVCPYCGFENARSDQCDNCGRLIKEGELKSPKSKITGDEVILKETEHYFFDWPKLSDFLAGYVSNKSAAWRGWIIEETAGWLKAGLKPRAITRDLEWGIEIPVKEIPKSQLIEGVEHKRIYVWFEAVIGYLSASIEWAEKYNKDWKDFWLTADSGHYYFMGKDNLVFHTLFWPGELHVFHPELHLPDVPFINHYLTLEGQKFSKSRGVVVDSGYISEKYGIDPVRFYLTAIMPEKTDANFSWQDFAARHNNVLIGTYANFINRTLNLAKDFRRFAPEDLDAAWAEDVLRRISLAKRSLAEGRFRDYIEALVQLAEAGNKYLSVKTPWLVKDESKKKEILTNALFAVLALFLAGKPLLIETDGKLSKMLGIKLESWPENEKESLETLLARVEISEPKPLFEKIEESEIEKEVKKLNLPKRD